VLNTQVGRIIVQGGPKISFFILVHIFYRMLMDFIYF